VRQMEGDKGESERPAAGDSIFRMADVVGDAWSWLILRDAVLHRIDRFDDFQSRLGIARSTLSARLGQLVTGGLLVRGEGSSYQLTDSGEDMLGCLMVAMRWGDRWHFPPGAPPQVVTHVSCGERFHAVTRCSTCHEILTAHDVTAVQVGPAAVAPSLVAGEKRRAPVLALLERERVCSIAKALTVTGDWWSGLIVRACFFGTRRFDEFQRRLEIAPNILSARLRRLVELEILTKEEYQAWPVRHEYRLTDKGLDLYDVPLSMLVWGRRWLQPSSSESLLTHISCGRTLSPEITCEWCAQRIERSDIVLDSGDYQPADRT
jgi:DNA-binding HxlR family transcriptional regulator